MPINSFNVPYASSCNQIFSINIYGLNIHQSFKFESTFQRILRNSSKYPAVQGPAINKVKIVMMYIHLIVSFEKSNTHYYLNNIN